MTDQDALQNLSWDQVIAALEAMDPADLAALMPGTGTDKLVQDFPELGAIEFQEHEIPSPGGPVPARSYRVPGATIGTGFVWVHGGAFIGGHLDMDEAHWVALTLAARGIAVLSVDYRKCLNGVRFPAPSDDVLAAWLWAHDRAEALGTAPERLHLGGASAGANLTAGVTKRLRDGAGPLPASLTLVYPLVHPELPPPSAELQAALASAQLTVDFPPEAIRNLNLNFTGGEAGLAGPYAFAANGDVSGQPPVYILNADADRLRASGEAYAEQLRTAGVRVEVEFEPGTQHGHVNEPYSPGGPRSIDRIARWLVGQ
jgi:acetyl esterase